MSGTEHLDKLSKCMNQHSTVLHFLDWLQNEKGIVLSVWGEKLLERINRNFLELVDEYFEIDRAGVDREIANLMTVSKPTNEKN